MDLSREGKAVKKEDKLDLDLDSLSTKRPLPSEKFRYQPITRETSNPELIISKSGNVKLRQQKISRRYHRSAETFNKMILNEAKRREKKLDTASQQRNTSPETISDFKHYVRTTNEDKEIKQPSYGKLTRKTIAGSIKRPNQLRGEELRKRLFTSVKIDNSSISNKPSSSNQLSSSCTSLLG